MLMRSASTPALNNSWNPDNHYLFSPSPEPEFLHRSIALPRSKPISLSANFSPASSSPYSDRATSTICRAMSATDLRHMSSITKTKSFARITEDRSDEEEYDDSESDSGEDYLSTVMMTSSGLGESRMPVAYAELDDEDECAVDGNTKTRSSTAGGNGGIYGGGNHCGGGDGYDGNGNSDYGVTDEYYMKMIEANPGNSLVLGNYAKFLKDVKGDLPKAEEYCGRAILANPNDGAVLSMYADLIWRIHTDESRAEMYFEQAVKAAPNDCYVLASHAHFLWDTEESEEENHEDELESGSSSPVVVSSTVLQGIHHPTILPPLAAAS